MDGKKSAKWRGGTSYALYVAVVAFLAYSNTLGNSLLWDDVEFITQWELPHDLSNLPLLLQGAVPPSHEGVFRPLRGLFYAVSYQLWGLNPAGYRIQAVMVHVACSILIYLVSVELLKNREAAVLCSLLFAAHPVHTEAVTFTASSFDLIGTIFMLSSMLLYLRAERLSAASAALALAAFLTDELTPSCPSSSSSTRRASTGRPGVCVSHTRTLRWQQDSSFSAFSPSKSSAGKATSKTAPTSQPSRWSSPWQNTRKSRSSPST
jgi:hypothetical protein